MKGFQNKMPPGKGQQEFRVDGIMDYQAMRILGNEGRTELMRALGVDAIVAAEVRVGLAGTTFAGIGNRYPKAHLTFQLFTPGTDAPDWFEGSIEGEEAKESVGKTAFFDEALLGRLSLESARTAFLKINKPKE